MKLAAIVLFAASLRAEAACPCLPAPANPQQTSVEGKPAYPGEVAAYGWGCAAHDAGYDACNTSSNLADGQADDWCQDQWCIVDPDNCSVRNLGVSYTAADDYFSYEACEANFAGNGWVGRCKNCDAPFVNSYCTCGGLDGCMCLPGATQQAQATGKPAYPGEVPAYGSGCKAHDAGHDACSTSNNTGVGQADDWCQDQWCFVDKDACKFKAIKVTYTAADNYFAYEACDAGFAGNGWVGRCKCEGAYNNSYCTCPTTADATTSMAAATATAKADGAVQSTWRAAAFLAVLVPVLVV